MRNEPARRLLALAKLLAGTRTGLTLDEMAHQLSVSRRTAERLRDSIAESFPQLESLEEGRIRRWRLPMEALSGLAQPTAEIVAAVELAARESEPDRRALLTEAAATLRAMLPGAALRRVEPDIESLMEAEGSAARPGPKPLVPPALLGTLRRAILGMQVVEARYAGAGGQGERRILCPYGLLRGGRGWLVAPVEGKPEPVLWRLSRLSELRVLDRGFTRDPDFNLSAYAARSFGTYQEPPLAVALRFAPDAAADAAAWQFHPSQTSETTPDRALIVRFSAGGTREMCWHLFTWGDSVSILEPNALRQELAEMAQAAARHHAEEQKTSFSEEKEAKRL